MGVLEGSLMLWRFKLQSQDAETRMSIVRVSPKLEH